MDNNYKIPEHVAIILDGNGRWAKKRKLPRTAGHVAGAKTLEKICDSAHELGIKYLTVYAFSTENWKRPVEEVTALTNLLRQYLKDGIKKSNKRNMRVSVIGDMEPLDDDLKEAIFALEEGTKNNTGIHFVVALNYGSRDEILRATKKMYKDIESGKLLLNNLNENSIRSYLDTADLPDPDLMIRTSGEIRLSNYLLWQLAYTEFYFTDVLWPDFNKEELVKAIEYYNSKDRRFGGIK